VRVVESAGCDDAEFFSQHPRVSGRSTRPTRPPRCRGNNSRTHIPGAAPQRPDSARNNRCAGLLNDCSVLHNTCAGLHNACAAPFWSCAAPLSDCPVLHDRCVGPLSGCSALHNR
jgi:hypothetical protein